MEISPNRVEVEDVTSVSVKVANTGGQAGTYKVVMSVTDGKHPAVTTSQDVQLNGGQSKAIIFPLSEKELGEYVVTIGNLSAKLSVEIF